MSASNKKSVVIVVDDKKNDIKEVAKDCRAAGLDVRDLLEFLGQITGEIEPEKADSLRHVRGVLSVEESHDYQLPPPDSEIQ